MIKIIQRVVLVLTILAAVLMAAAVIKTVAGCFEYSYN